MGIKRQSGARVVIILLGVIAIVGVPRVCAEGRLFLSREAEASPTVVLQDPSNLTWMIQRSFDMLQWGDVTTLSVMNQSARFENAFPPSLASATPQLFYRAVCIHDRVQRTGTVAEALALPAVPFNYANIVLPPHFNSPQIQADDNTPDDDPITDTGATLGRVLFYDRQLSVDGTVSCASCHHQAFGFSDPDQFSRGVNGLTRRNSMGLSNARYYRRGHYFWDERADTLEHQVLEPIGSVVEMGFSITGAVTRLSGLPYYAELFEDAFGDPTVTSEGMGRAMAQFIRSILSFDSRYDQGVPVNFTNFTDEENLGRILFLGSAGCAECHRSHNFVPGNRVDNIGLDNPYTDNGVGEISELETDNGKFKVPSLRNIALTAPYQHDGRHDTLREVVEHYNSGILPHPNLSAALRTAPPNSVPSRLNLTPGEVDAIVAFLRTLTDFAFTTDEKYADPFRYDTTCVE